MLSKGEDKLTRWVEHFQEVLNYAGMMTFKEDPETSADPFPIYVGDFTEAEVQEVIICMMNHKVPGTDGITAEMMKAGGEYYLMDDRNMQPSMEFCRHT